MSVLRVEKLRYADWGPFDLVVAAGCCTAVTGPSGSGKTLLLRALADLDPHDGVVLLDGLRCADLPAPAWRRQVGLLPAESVWWWDTVGEHFEGVDATLLERLGFDRGVLGWPVGRLSSGERQRLALARLLSNRPAALLLDEPTASLDPDSVERVEGIVRDYRVQRDAPVIWVTHDHAQANRVAGKTLVLNGRLLTGTRPNGCAS